jgi:hypothetical protein
VVTDHRDEAGRFAAGNRFWEARSSAGPKPKFNGPEKLWTAISEYFEWNEANPLWEARAFSFQGDVKIEKLPKLRAMTLAGLCQFLDVSMSTWDEWRNSRPDLSEVMTRAEGFIRRQKFEGASADLLNANIIARDLGLADNQRVSGADGGALIVQVMKFADDTPAG